MKKVKLGVVVSDFNDFITKRLLKACLEELHHLGILENNITLIHVPGSFEIPLMALKLAQKKSISAVICLGAVIRGETIHFELVAQEAAVGIREVMLRTEKPIIFGILTTNTTNQAYKRSQIKGANKGKDAARAAVSMIRSLKNLPAGRQV